MAYDLYQQTFALSWLANSAAGLSLPAASQPDLQEILQTNITNALNNTQNQISMGGWALVWGPVVFTAPTDTTAIADNAMYVAQGKDANGNPVYVVAVAATNWLSGYDWSQEDFLVSSTVPFNYGTAVGTPLLSTAVGNGLDALLQMSDPVHGTLLAFLQKIPAAGTTSVIFTGHSLGGALAPALALALFNTGTNNFTTNFANVWVYPTAGPTPGNDGFAETFQACFKVATTNSNSHQNWNQLLWNSFDVVPHAWDKADLFLIPALYTTLPQPVLGALVTYFVAETAFTTYTRLPNVKLTGKLNPEIPVVYTDFGAYAKQAYYQHIQAYLDLIGITPLSLLPS